MSVTTVGLDPAHRRRGKGTAGRAGFQSDGIPPFLIPPNSGESNRVPPDSLQRQHQPVARGRRRLFQLAQGRGVAEIFQPLRRGPGGLQRAGEFGQRSVSPHPADQQGRLSPKVSSRSTKRTKSAPLSCVSSAAG